MCVEDTKRQFSRSNGALSKTLLALANSLAAPKRGLRRDSACSPMLVLALMQHHTLPSAVPYKVQCALVLPVCWATPQLLLGSSHGVAHKWEQDQELQAALGCGPVGLLCCLLKLVAKQKENQIGGNI